MQALHTPSRLLLWPRVRPSSCAAYRGYVRPRSTKSNSNDARPSLSSYAVDDTSTDAWGVWQEPDPSTVIRTSVVPKPQSKRRSPSGVPPGIELDVWGFPADFLTRDSVIRGTVPRNMDDKVMPEGYANAGSIKARSVVSANVEGWQGHYGPAEETTGIPRILKDYSDHPPDKEPIPSRPRIQFGDGRNDPYQKGKSSEDIEAERAKYREERMVSPKVWFPNVVNNLAETAKYREELWLSRPKIEFHTSKDVLAEYPSQIEKLHKNAEITSLEDFNKASGSLFENTADELNFTKGILTRSELTAHPPINIHEFESMLQNVFYPDEIPSRIGLAISGGVDSMALALLARNYNRTLEGSGRERIDFVAFTVDHSARPASSQEASHICRLMQTEYEMGAKVLKINWDRDASTGKGFETVARRFRHRLLANAILDTWPGEERNHLLMGHHLDDNAETILMRLVNNSGVRGLSGIRARAPIPECNTVWQADTIHIFRPFLSVSKKRLVATAQVANIAWLEDETNRDPGMTQRNTIRALLTAQPSPLPTAFQAPSLGAFGGRLAAADAPLKLLAYEYLERCRTVYDTAANSLLFHPFPDARTVPDDVFSTALNLLTKKVTPISTTLNLDNMAEIGRNIFEQEKSGRRADWRTTEGAVLFTFKKGKTSAESTLVLSRQPFTNPDQRSTHREHHYLLQADDLTGGGRWILWDGRFWIHTGPGTQLFGKELAIEHADEGGMTDIVECLVIRPYNQFDLEEWWKSMPCTNLPPWKLRKVMKDKKSSIKHLHDFQSPLAAETIPVVVWITRNHHEYVVGLPSLNVAGSNHLSIPITHWPAVSKLHLNCIQEYDEVRRLRGLSMEEFDKQQSNSGCHSAIYEEQSDTVFKGSEKPRERRYFGCPYINLPKIDRNPELRPKVRKFDEDGNYLLPPHIKSVHAHVHSNPSLAAKIKPEAPQPVWRARAAVEEQEENARLERKTKLELLQEETRVRDAAQRFGSQSSFGADEISSPRQGQALPHKSGDNSTKPESSASRIQHSSAKAPVEDMRLEREDLLRTLQEEGRAGEMQRVATQKSSSMTKDSVLQEIDRHASTNITPPNAKQSVKWNKPLVLEQVEVAVKEELPVWRARGVVDAAEAEARRHKQAGLDARHRISVGNRI